MINKEKIKKDLEKLGVEALELIQLLSPKEKSDSLNFFTLYQSWYTQAVKAVEFLAPDRYEEFKSYYEIDPKRKKLGYGTYVIQDYIKGVFPGGYSRSDFDTVTQTSQNVFNQFSILRSLTSRIDSIISNAESALYAEIQDAELETAKKLVTISHRAAGSLAGVILEGYLQKVVKNHKLSIRKKNPTISDLNDPLKQKGVYDTSTWRKISYLGDVRNLCSHKKSSGPTVEQVNELIDGVNWVLKNVI